MEHKKTILSGVQPSGVLTLGNYIGALRNWRDMQNEFNSYFMVVDLHAITVRQNPDELRQRVLDVLALYIASGIDPKKNTLFIQSHVPEHSQLSWVLNCYTYLGELSRMTQFKDKSKKNEDNINAGLFTYPVLMAADILLYQADVVPVGEDQRQHLEITRDIAQRFNAIHNGTFKVPDPYIAKVGARIMSLQEPDKKMSKSDANVNGFISLLDEPDVILKKFKKSVTDSENSVRYSEEKLGIKNLMSIYSSMTNKTIPEIEQEFEGKGYGAFKQAVAESVIAGLSPIQSEFKRLQADKTYLQSIYKEGAEKARVTASKTLKDVYDKVGFII